MPTTTVAAPPANPVAPCARCGTRGGAHEHGSGRPSRTRRLCKSCYGREQRASRLARWPRRAKAAGPSEHVTCAWCGERFLAKPSARRKFCSQRCANHGRGPVPGQPPALVRPADIGITAADVAERLAAATRRLLAETRRAELRGLAWRQAHPAQFAPASVAALFPFGLACSRWAGTDDREAAR